MHVFENLSWKVVLLPLLVMVAVNWLAWIWGWGRFKNEPGIPNEPQQRTDSNLRQVLAKFFTTIIDEFRHLLALIIVLVFAVTMGLAMYPGLVNHDIDGMLKAVQAVAASLGGLLGSIIGYYFGESAASKSNRRLADTATTTDTEHSHASSEARTG
jgi:hypothetical protein